MEELRTDAFQHSQSKARVRVFNIAEILVVLIGLQQTPTSQWISDVFSVITRTSLRSLRHSNKFQPRSCRRYVFKQAWVICCARGPESVTRAKRSRAAQVGKHVTRISSHPRFFRARRNYFLSDPKMDGSGRFRSWAPEQRIGHPLPSCQKMSDSLVSVHTQVDTTRSGLGGWFRSPSEVFEVNLL